MAGRAPLRHETSKAVSLQQVTCDQAVLSHRACRSHAAAIIAMIALSACSPQASPIAVSAYCEVKGTERLDLTDKGIRGLTPENKRAVLTGDDNYRALCGPKSSGLAPGPR